MESSLLSTINSHTPQSRGVKHLNCSHPQKARMPISWSSVGMTTSRSAMQLRNTSLPICVSRGGSQMCVMATHGLEEGCDLCAHEIFFCTSTDAMWAVCPGHRCKERKHVMMMGNKTQENTQNAAKQTKNKQPNNHNQNKTKGQKADSPSKTTVFPLYGGETGENEDNIQSKGLNSLRKSAKCICARAKSLRSQSNVASF